MKYSIDTLLRGIRVVQDAARAKNQERLDQNIQYLSGYINHGRAAALSMAEVLFNEADRIRRGYGTYRTEGITQSFWTELAAASPVPKAVPRDYTVRDLKEKIKEGTDLVREDMPPCELEVLLTHAKSLGETTVSFSFLTRSGHAPRYINAVALAGVTDEGASGA